MRTALLVLPTCLVALASCEVQTYAVPPRPAVVVQAEVAPPPPPRVVVRAPPPPAVVVETQVPAPPPRVIVQAPPPPPRVVVQAPPPPRVVFEVLPDPVAVPPVVLRFDVAAGRPPGLRPGAPLGYWIWHDDWARQWHVRATTRDQLHRFQGTVIGEGGPIVQFDATHADWGDRVRARPNGIDFDFQTQGEQDGFDFRVAGNHCVRFYMMVDGRPQPGAIHIGGGEARPSSWHFRLCP